MSRISCFFLSLSLSLFVSFDRWSHRDFFLGSLMKMFQTALYRSGSSIGPGLSNAGLRIEIRYFLLPLSLFTSLLHHFCLYSLMRMFQLLSFDPARPGLFNAGLRIEIRYFLLPPARFLAVSSPFLRGQISHSGAYATCYLLSRAFADCCLCVLYPLQLLLFCELVGVTVGVWQKLRQRQQ
jgi:hypothetical protein